MSRQPWTDADHARLLALRQAGQTYRQIAAVMGRTAATVQRHAYGLGVSRRPCGVRWTVEEDNELTILVEQHRSYEEIAVRLGRTKSAVADRSSVLHCKISTANGRTLEATARLMGVEHDAVEWWIREGWLIAYRTDSRWGRGLITIVEHDDLLAFLEREDCWHVWEPARIQQRRLRLWAEELRQGVAFLTTGQAGERLGLTHYQVNKLIRQGRIRAVKHGPNWLIRSDWCVYPAWLPRPKGRRATDADRAVIRRHWGEIPGSVLAERLGLGQRTVYMTARAMGLPPVGRGCWKRRQAVSA